MGDMDKENTMNADKWNALSTEERRTLVMDSMDNDPDWATLADKMAASTFERLSHLQQDMVSDL